MEGPKVGVAVFIKKDGKFLVMKRQGSHGADTWALPGGHVEAGEDLEETCKREILEEVGIHIKNILPLTFRNAIFEKEQKHYVNLFFAAEYDSGEAEILEPAKCTELRWCKLSEIPEPRFGTLSSVIDWLKDNFV